MLMFDEQGDAVISFAVTSEDHRARPFFCFELDHAPDMHLTQTIPISRAPAAVRDELARRVERIHVALEAMLNHIATGSDRFC